MARNTEALSDILRTAPTAAQIDAAKALLMACPATAVALKALLIATREELDDQGTADRLDQAVSEMADYEADLI